MLQGGGDSSQKKTVTERGTCQGALSDMDLSSMGEVAGMAEGVSAAWQGMGQSALILTLRQSLLPAARIKKKSLLLNHKESCRVLKKKFFTINNANYNKATFEMD